jgi:DNA-binding beta-propeller fold protein YncE
VLAVGDKILIADTYNHKIKELDAKQRTVKTFLGNGKPGQADGAAPSFYEPAGLAVANGKLYVADTNNHAVRVIDLNNRETSTLNIKGLQPPSSSANPGVENESGPNVEEVKLAPQILRAGTNASVIAQVELPAGYHLNPSAPQRYRVSVESGSQQLGLLSETEAGTTGHEKAISRSLKNLQLPLRIPIRTFEAGKAELRLQLTLFYCREDNTGTCRIKTLVWRAPVEVATDGSAPNEVKLHGKLVAVEN